MGRTQRAGGGMVTFGNHADKVGVVGATFASLCCLGAAPILAVLSAAGLGFLINDAILLPLLLVSLLLTFWGLWAGWRRHGRILALAVGGVAGIAMPIFIFVIPSRPAAYAGIAVLVGATVLNVVLLRQRVRAARAGLVPARQET